VARANRKTGVGGSAAGGAPKARKVLRRKSCFFCKEKVVAVDYKNVAQLRRSITERAKIKSRANTGTCRKHQKQVSLAIKRAREMALLPYVGDAQEPKTRPGSRRPE